MNFRIFHAPCSRVLTGLLLIVLFTIPRTMLAQPWLRPSIVATQKSLPVKPDFREVQRLFEMNWKNKSVDRREENNRLEGGYQQFKRWEWFMKQRCFPSGNPIDPEILFKESRRYQAVAPVARHSSLTASWNVIGPAVVPASGGGAGRINVVRVQPGNNNVLYIGAACGGVWKSVNGGASWSPLSDFIPSISVADIAINPRHPDTVYVATGDGYGYESSNVFWGGTYSAGVMMSPDGGQTWQQSGLTYSQTNSEIIQRISIKPDEPEVLLASTRHGLYRSANSGQTWTLVRPGHHFDIEFLPTRPDTVFASSESELLWSLNGGATWAVRQAGICSGRFSLAVSPANVNRVYMLCEDGNLFRSDDLGSTLQTITDPSGANFYGYYDAVLAVSPTNANVIVCGGSDMVKSVDGGTSWNIIGSSVHPDQHYLEFQQGSGTVLYSCNDGGIFKSTNGGGMWQDISSGLSIKQYYRLALSASDAATIYAGAQDNGTDQWTAGNWTRVLEGDGMDCMVDYQNNQVVYASYQYGALHKSTNGGLSFTDISPASGAWVTPFAMHPSNPQIIYGGYVDAYRSDDGGVNWNTISSGQFNDMLIALDVNRLDPDHLYAATMDHLYHTADGGNTWTDITGSLPVSNATITGVTSSYLNPSVVWVTFSGYSNGQKVFVSTNAGAAWTNFSGTLPNLPVNCIVEQINATASGSLYIGTDFGVFRRDSTLNDWIPFTTGMPNVIVDDLDIQYSSGKLRAATYGRGIWETDLNGFVPVTLDVAVIDILQPAGVYCGDSVAAVAVLGNVSVDTVTSLTVQTLVDGSVVGSFLLTDTLLPGTVDTIHLAPFMVSAGHHSIEIRISGPNNGVDQNTLNDRRSSVFIILPAAVHTPVAEDFETQQIPPHDWSILDPASLYQVGTGVGGFGLSSTSLLANCYDVAAGSALFISPNIDLVWSTPPVSLHFNLAYAPYSAAYHDSLIISISTDCGHTFTRLFAKGDDSLATAPAIAAKFIPQASDWAAESIDLTPYVGLSNVLIRFEAISGYGNDLYLDDINIFGSNTGTVDPMLSEFSVYPNPVSNRLNVRLPVNAIGHTLAVIDVAGRRLTSMEVSKETEVLDLEQFSPGWYQVVLMDGSVRGAALPFVKY